jgi:hypothetical protein
MQNFAGKPEGRRPVGRCKHKLENIIKIYLEEMLRGTL